ncbi:hypothetical protein [Streptomyces sp. NPDC059166]|uniref:hypothetical protein n=1 Tax=Streptomyces sp. NPDC059166 TaxID=3346752 RepID=UPI0036BB43FA
MADEQQAWLDAELAERLLRGESVEAVDDHAGQEIRRLEAALRVLRTPGPAGGELPGEAAVMAAFREAPRGARRPDAAVSETGTGQPEALHTVRIGVAPTAPVRRRSRWTRPVRYGLAVSIAGCALGGVAVAAGTGMLPAPFGGHGSPAPATSVSAAASPEELGVEVPDPVAPSPPPSAPSGAPDSSRAPGRGADGAGGGAPTGPGPGDDTATGRQDPGRGAAPEGAPDTGTKPGGAAEAYRRSLAACRAYRADTLSREEERRLLVLAGGRRNLDRFCDRMLGPGDGDGEGGRDDGKGNGGDDGENGGKDGGEGGGALPSITFSTPSPGSPQDASGQDGDVPEPAAGHMPALVSVTP